ncbi:MAG: hypothetical protein HND52_16975 [Ignavibacteriae bacterium]|nr:hypothetical protein [Ignavibacteriota bacterium]NOG99654.1 hypothetical protein [Ignavibacteriota bacterium]
MKKLFFIFLLTLTYTINLTTNAEVRFVSKTGSSTPPYTSWATAADSIQKCIDISSFGDTIFVGEGTYREFVRLNEGRSLIGTGYDNCIIDGRTLGINSDTTNLIEIKDSCLISGFKIIVSNFFVSFYRGHAIWAHTDSTEGNYTSTIKNNFITQAYYGIRTNLIDAIITENIITECEVGIIFSLTFYSSDHYVSENIIRATGTSVKSGPGNKANIYNNVIYLESTTAKASVSNWELNFYNNLIISKGNSSRGVANSTFTTNIINNTFIGYTVIPILAHDNNVIKNNIIFNSGIGIDNDALNTTIKYNCLWDLIVISRPYPLDTTNIIADPMFADTSNEDYHLQMFSPCIDVGDPTIFDKDGSRSDIGVYGGPNGESYTYQNLDPRPPRNIHGEIIEENKVKIDWKPNSEADLFGYKIYRDSIANFSISPLTLISAISDTVFIEEYKAETNLYYKVTAIDSTENESEPGEEVTILLTGINEIEIKEKDFQLYQNYPNPFNPTTNISFHLDEPGFVKLIIYDAKGEKINQLISKEMGKGYFEVEYPAENNNNNLAAGVYVYSITITGKDKKIRHAAKKMMLLK